MQQARLEPTGPIEPPPSERTSPEPRASLSLVAGDLSSAPLPNARRHSEKGPAPKDRLLEAGADALSDAELLAVILGPPRPGRSTALQKAASLLDDVGGLRELRRSGVVELTHLPAMTATKAATLVAAMELGRRAASQGVGKEPSISCPNDVDNLMRPRLAHLDRENFVVLLLDTKNRVMASPTVSVGTLNSSLVHPREVFKPAVKVSASSVVLVHNHPSGDVAPSMEDREVTKRLKAAGEVFGIEVLDHVIIGDTFFSMKEASQF